MLGTIEELEKDIEQFQKNVAASNELQELLKQMIEQVKLQSSDFNSKSTELLEQLDKVPADIQHENSTNSKRLVKNIANEIDQMLRSLNEEQEKYIESMNRTQNEIANCENQLKTKYSEFMDSLEKMNVADLYDQNIQMRKDFNKRTMILMIISVISVIVGLLGIVLPF